MDHLGKTILGYIWPSWVFKASWLHWMHRTIVHTLSVLFVLFCTHLFYLFSFELIWTHLYWLGLVSTDVLWRPENDSFPKFHYFHMSQRTHVPRCHCFLNLKRLICQLCWSHCLSWKLLLDKKFVSGGVFLIQRCSKMETLSTHRKKKGSLFPTMIRAQAGSKRWTAYFS